MTAAEDLARDQACPRCGSKEWFPGAACWHCGWEWGPEAVDRLTPEERNDHEYDKRNVEVMPVLHLRDALRRALRIIDRLAPKPRPQSQHHWSTTKEMHEE